MSNMQNKPPNLKFQDFNFQLQDNSLCLPLFPERILLLNIKMNQDMKNVVRKGDNDASFILKKDHSSSIEVQPTAYPRINGSKVKTNLNTNSGNCFALLKLEMPSHMTKQTVSKSKNTSASEKKVNSLSSRSKHKNIVSVLKEKYKKVRRIQKMRMFKRLSLLMKHKKRTPIIKRKFHYSNLNKPSEGGENVSNSTTQDFFISCRFCRKSYKKLENVLSHECNKSKHSNDELKHTCNLCSMVFKYKNYLDRHLKGHNRNNCKICSAQFTKRKALCKHLKLAHNLSEPETMHSCTYCSKTFTKRLLLYAHVKTHIGSKYLCIKCGFMCPNEASYVEHSKEHVKEAKFECPLCGQKFIRRQQHKQHMRLHEKYSCSTCSVTFATKKLLLKHDQSIHGVNNMEKKHFCPICKKSFMRPMDLRIHLRIHTGEKPLKCNQCEKNFSDKRSLMKHLKTARHLQLVNDGKAVEVEKPFLCSTCGAKFFRQQSLMRHIEMLHTPGEAFKCSQCEYSTKCKANLKRHEERHTNIKRYVCEVCGASFRALATLKEHHAFVHSESRNFICEKCNKGFKNKSSLQRHMRIHSEIRPFKCHCNRDYKRLSHLKRHMISAHKMTVKKSYDNKNIEVSDMDTNSNTAVMLSIPEDTSKSNQSTTEHVDSFLTSCDQNFLPPELFPNHLNNFKNIKFNPLENKKLERSQGVHEFLNKNVVSTCVTTTEKNPPTSDGPGSIDTSDSRDSVSMSESHVNLTPEDYFTFSSSGSPLNIIENAAPTPHPQAILRDTTPVPPEDKCMSNLNFQPQSGDSLFPFPMRFGDFSSIPESFLLGGDLTSQPIESASSSKQLFEESSDILALPLFAASQDAGFTDCSDNLFDSSRDNDVWVSGSDGRLRDNDAVGEKVSTMADFNTLPCSSNSFLPCGGEFQNDPLLNCGLDANSFAAEDFFFS